MSLVPDVLHFNPVSSPRRVARGQLSGLELLDFALLRGTKLLLGFDRHVSCKIPRYFVDDIVVSSSHLGSWIPFVPVRISFDRSTHVSTAYQ